MSAVAAKRLLQPSSPQPRFDFIKYLLESAWYWLVKEDACMSQIRLAAGTLVAGIDVLVELQLHRISDVSVQRNWFEIEMITGGASFKLRKLHETVPCSS